MSRINAVDPKAATGEAKALLNAVQKQTRHHPQFHPRPRHSPKALSGFLGLYGVLGVADIDKATQERIALALAESNGCQYCVSAHTAIGRHAGLTNDEMLLNRQGSSADARAAAAVAFAKVLNDNAGEVTTAEFEAVRSGIQRRGNRGDHCGRCAERVHEHPGEIDTSRHRFSSGFPARRFTIRCGLI